MDKNWTQTELAAHCQLLGWNASREMINHIEMQIRLVRDYEVVALAKALKISPLDLLAADREALKRLRVDCSAADPATRGKIPEGSAEPE